MAQGKPPDSILHARRHSSQQVCRHRITGQQLSEHPAADTVLVPLTWSVFKPTTRILSLQLDVEKQRTTHRMYFCPPTDPPTGHFSMSHLTENVNKQCRKIQQKYCFLEELWTHSLSQREDRFFFCVQRWIDGKMIGWTKGCQDSDCTGDKLRGKQRTGVSPETNKPAQHPRGRNLRWKRSRPPTSQGLLILRKSTFNKNPVSTTQVRNFSKDTNWIPPKATVHAPVMSVLSSPPKNEPNWPMFLFLWMTIKPPFRPYY